MSREINFNKLDLIPLNNRIQEVKIEINQYKYSIYQLSKHLEELKCKRDKIYKENPELLKEMK